MDDIKEDYGLLSEADQKFIKSEKDDFNMFIEICNENGFSQEILQLMRNIADTPGFIENSTTNLQIIKIKFSRFV